MKIRSELTNETQRCGTYTIMSYSRQTSENVGSEELFKVWILV